MPAQHFSLISSATTCSNRQPCWRPGRENVHLEWVQIKKCWRSIHWKKLFFLSFSRARSLAAFGWFLLSVSSACARALRSYFHFFPEFLHNRADASAMQVIHKLFSISRPFFFALFIYFYFFPPPATFHAASSHRFFRQSPKKLRKVSERGKN